MIVVEETADLIDKTVKIEVTKSLQTSVRSHDLWRIGTMSGQVHKAYSTVLLAVGSGSRMAADRNKIFLTLADKAIFQYALDLFLSDSDCKQVILVGKAEEKTTLRIFCQTGYVLL